MSIYCCDNVINNISNFSYLGKIKFLLLYNKYISQLARL